ncbi:glycosyltransferase family protein [Actinophytocola gossypii]|uniref:Glycosyltransferase family protein n=1 Tax=Actinophytocola gossypii TaxID=2812003 RepID=A0ABT2JKA4_9PSEU|nr:glycosyltransferase family protein [Actinophytocola gossypii]MCT2588305.1 glycosyltransferase family protein [Actinophytocola gossypii]
MAPVRVHAVIQARMSSTRLPGKVLRPLGARSVLAWVVRAAARVPAFDQVIVATSEAADDDPVAAEAERAGATVVRGPLDDVLGRFELAAERHPCDAVVRLTADCPLHDPALLAQVAGVWLADPDLHYVSNTLLRRLPRGFDAELVRRDVLAEQYRVATGTHREHVTSDIHSRPEVYRCAGVVPGEDDSDLRVTLDTAEDAELLDAVVTALGDGVPRWRDVVALLRARPDLVALNAGVAQRVP